MSADCTSCSIRFPYFTDVKKRMQHSQSWHLVYFIMLIGLRKQLLRLTFQEGTKSVHYWGLTHWISVGSGSLGSLASACPQTVPRCGTANLSTQNALTSATVQLDEWVWTGHYVTFKILRIYMKDCSYVHALVMVLSWYHYARPKRYMPQFNTDIPHGHLILTPSRTVLVLAHSLDRLMNRTTL